MNRLCRAPLLLVRRSFLEIVCTPTQSNVVIAGAVPDAESVRALVGPATLRFTQRDGSLGPPILFEDMYYVPNSVKIISRNGLQRRLLPTQHERDARCRDSYVDMTSWDIAINKKHLLDTVEAVHKFHDMQAVQNNPWLTNPFTYKFK